MVLLTPALFPIIFANTRDFLKHRLSVVGVFLLCLAPYGLFFIAHHFSDFLFNGPIHDFSSMIPHILRSEYQTHDISPYETPGDKARILGEMLFFACKQMHYIGVLPIFWGVVFLWRSQRYLAITSILAVASSSVILMLFRSSAFSQLTAEIYAAYQMVPLFMLAFAAGIGSHQIVEKLRDKPGIWAVTPALLTLGVVILIYSYKRADNYIDSFGNDYAKTLLRSLPTNSILLTSSDSDAGSLGYAHYSEGVRPDILLTSQVSAFFPHRIFSRQTDFKNDRHKEKLLEYLSTRLGKKKRVFTIGKIPYFEPDEFPYKYSDYGVMKEITQTQQDPVFTQSMINNFRLIADKYINHEYSKRWQGHREQIITGICHLLLINGIKHPVISKVDGCQLLHARFLHSEKKDYKKANKLLIRQISLNKSSSLQTKSTIYREYLVNKVAQINNSELSHPDKAKMFTTLGNVVRPYIKRYPICGNKAALNFYELAFQTPIKVHWEFYNRYYAKCSWAQKLKKYMEGAQSL